MDQDFTHDIESAIQLRETGSLTQSRALFEALLKQVKQKNPHFPRLIGEYIIQLRLESKSLLSKALTLGQKFLAEERKKSNPNPLSLRSISNTLVDLGGFEAAIPYLQELCRVYPTNSLRQGETQAHLALAYLRVSKLAEASKLIKEAILNIEKNTAKETYVEVRVSYALIVESLIEYNLDQKDLAIRHASTALEIATKGKAIHRIAQAKELLSFLSRP